MNESENGRKSVPMMLLLAVLAFLGIRSFAPDAAGPSGERPKEDRRAGEKRDENADAANGVERFWQPLKAFRDAGAASDLSGEMPKDLLNINGWDTRCLIACVPDPIESSSGYRFDGLIDALQRATETQGYVEDRYFYPWTKRNEGGKGLSNGQCDTSKQSDWRRQPGVLLLRDSSRSCLLVVFLVGETATAGIHKEAFAASLQLIGQSDEYRRTHTVHVLGPYFSGSQVSLERAIQAWAKCADKTEPPPKCAEKAESPLVAFQVISGSATSIDKKRLEHCCDRACVTFHATVTPERYVFRALAEHLDLGSYSKDGPFQPRHKFAVLYESNTTFGHQTVQARMQNMKSRGPTAEEPMFFPFPLHISAVRGAYSKTTSGTKGSTVRLPSFGNKLDLPAQDDNHSRDVEPALDGPATAVISERLLAQTLETISHERFPHVFIQATDVKDKLFLADLVRQQCPDCRLVFTDSDLLFGHPDFSADLRGSIVGSTYPLHARNQRWSFPFQGNKTRFFFPGPGEQGCYNAVIALLNPKCSRALIEYGPPFLNPNSQAVDPQRPPVWISIVGQGGLYPLKAIPARRDGYDDYVYPADPESDRQSKAEFVPSYSGLLIATVLAMALLLGYLGWSYFSVVDWPWRTARQHGTALQELVRPRSPRLRGRQPIHAFVCLISVLVVFCHLTFVCLLPFGFMLAILTIFLLVLLALFLFRAYLGNLIEPRFLIRYRSHLACAFLLAIMTVFLCFYGKYRQSSESLLFAERAASLASGVSPVVPIVLIGLAFFFWSYAQLKRLYLLDAYAVANPFPPKQKLFEQVNLRHDEVAENLQRPERALDGKGAFLAVVCVVLLFTFGYLYSRFVPAAEGAFVEGLILFGLAVFAMMIVYGWLYLRKVWESTRHLLNALALLPQPFQEAFARIPTALTKMFGPFLSSQRPGRQEHLSYRLEQLRLLREEHARITAERKVVIPLDIPEREGPDSEVLTDSARACLIVLQQVWRDPDLQARAEAEPALRLWLTRATDFAALETMAYLGQFFVHLRNLAVFLSFTPLLVLLAATSYPFQPQRLWMYLSVALIGLTTLSVISIVVQIERHELVSRILKTTPNQLNFHWGFLSRLILYILPLFGVLAAMSSEVSNLVHSLIDPLLQMMK